MTQSTFTSRSISSYWTTRPYLTSHYHHILPHLRCVCVCARRWITTSIASMYYWLVLLHICLWVFSFHLNDWCKLKGMTQSTFTSRSISSYWTTRPYLTSHYHHILPHLRCVCVCVPVDESQRIGRSYVWWIIRYTVTTHALTYSNIVQTGNWSTYKRIEQQTLLYIHAGELFPITAMSLSGNIPWPHLSYTHKLFRVPYHSYAY